MPRFITALLLSFSLVLASTVSAQTKPVTHSEGMHSPIAPAVSDERKDNLRKLARKICRYMTYDEEKFVRKSTAAILKHMRTKENLPDATEVDILPYLNAHQAHMQCRDKRGKGDHYMVHAFKNGGEFKLFTKFLNKLPNPDNLILNVNVLVSESPEGKPETLLDYMQRVHDRKGINDNAKNAMYTRIEMFKRVYKAKTFAQLLTAHPELKVHLAQ